MKAVRARIHPLFYKPLEPIPPPEPRVVSTFAKLRAECAKLEQTVLNQQREINHLKRRIAELESHPNRSPTP